MQLPYKTDRSRKRTDIQNEYFYCHFPRCAIVKGEAASGGSGGDAKPTRITRHHKDTKGTRCHHMPPRERIDCFIVEYVNQGSLVYFPGVLGLAGGYV